MKYFCQHKVGYWIEADTEDEAKEQLCEMIKDNIEPSHITIEGENNEKN